MADSEFISVISDEGVIVQLPHPPAGHYWRVYKGSLHIDHLSLRKKGRWLDKTVVDTMLFFRDKTNIIREPAEVLWEAASSIMEEISASKEWEKYYGDYAPVKK